MEKDHRQEMQLALIIMSFCACLVIIQLQCRVKRGEFSSSSNEDHGMHFKFVHCRATTDLQRLLQHSIVCSCQGG